MCFSIANSFAQFKPIGPVGSATYNSTSKPNSASGLGQIHCIAFPPDYNNSSKPYSYQTIYAGSPMGGLWKSTDEGESWNIMTSVSSLPLNSVADMTIMPDPNALAGYRIYICQNVKDPRKSRTGTLHISQTGLYVSYDAGASFQHVTGLSNAMASYNRGYGQTWQFAYDQFNSNLMYAATTVGLFKSSNAGSTWIRILDDPSAPIGFYSVATSPNTSGTIYAGSSNIVRSTDFGATFSSFNVPHSVSDGLNVYGCHDILSSEKINLRVYKDNNTDRLFANEFSTYSFCNGGNRTNAIFQCTAANTATPQWSRLKGVLDSSFYIKQAFNLQVPGRTDFAVHYNSITQTSNFNVVIGGNTQAMLTADGGQAWHEATGYDRNGHADIHAVEFMPGYGTEVLIGCDGGIFKYSLTNGSVTELNNGLNNILIWGLSTSKTLNGYMVATRQDCGSDWYNGSEWTMTATGGDGYSPALWYGNKSKENSFLVSTNGNLVKWDINTDSRDLGFNSSCFESIDFSTQLFQNNESYSNAEIFYNSNHGGKDTTMIGVRQSLDFGNNFYLIDSINTPWAASSRSIYISPSNFNQIYLWNYSFDQSVAEAKLFLLDRSQYDQPNLCKNSASLRGTSSGKASSFRELKTLPTDDYTITANCSYWGCYNGNAKIANYFPISAVAASNISNTNDNNINTKVWVAYEFDPLEVGDISQRYFIRKTNNIDDNNPVWDNDDVGDVLKTLGLPINNLIYYDGSDDMLFCSTIDGRVFYKCNSKPQWTELDPTLPHSTIMKMEINYCTQKLVIGTWGAGVWTYDLTKIPEKQIVEITKEVKWENKNIEIAGDLIIRKGGKLELKETTLNMAKGSKIIIEEGEAALLPSQRVNGGRLVADESTIWNSCGEMWDGIEVRGVNFAEQITLAEIRNLGYSGPFTQGLIQIQASNIMQMKNGIVCKNGAQIFVKTSSFLNNEKSITIEKYMLFAGTKQIYKSSIERCTFDIQKPMPFNRHISLIGNMGVHILGNTFDNSGNSAAADNLNKGIGVFINDAYCDIVPHETTAPAVTTKNTFSNLTWGVFASNTGWLQGTAPVTGRNFYYRTLISKNVFNNVRNGIFAVNLDSTIITDNEINVPYLLQSCPGPQGGLLPVCPERKSYGIYMYGCIRYKLQENRISSTAPPTVNQTANTPTASPYGIVVNNGFSIPVSIRKNDITGTRYAITAAGINSGLLLQCNNFYNNVYSDIWLTEYKMNNQIISGEIFSPQGLRDSRLSYEDQCAKPFSANRFFNYSSTVPKYNIARNSSTVGFTYNFLSPNLNAQLNYKPNNLSLNSFSLAVIDTFGCSNSLPYENYPGLAVCPTEVIQTDWTPQDFLRVNGDINLLKAKMEEVNNTLTTMYVNSEPLADILTEINSSAHIQSPFLYLAINHADAINHLNLLRTAIIKHAGYDDRSAEFLAKQNLPYTQEEVQSMRDVAENQPSSETRYKVAVVTMEREIEDILGYVAQKQFDAGNADEGIKTLGLYHTAAIDAHFAEASAKHLKAQPFLQSLKQLRTYPQQHPNRNLATYLEWRFGDLLLPRLWGDDVLWTLYEKGDYASGKAAAELMKKFDTILLPYLPDEELEFQEKSGQNK